MQLTLTGDPIMTGGDVQRYLAVSDPDLAILIANGLAEKLKRYTARVQINQNILTDIVEKILPYGGDRLYLHAPIWTGTNFTIEAKVYEGTTLLETYTYGGGDFGYFTSDKCSYLTLPGGNWPDQTLRGHVQVTYKGGWATIPGDVIQGAIMQGRIDIQRMNGEVGMTSRGAQGESTSYQSAGIVEEVADLWKPYRVMV